MKCQKCKTNEATYHTSITINGQTTEEHLCAECAIATGKMPHFKTIDVGEFFDSYVDNYKKAKSIPKAIICPGCGMLSTDFLSTGFVGCSMCYKAFENLLQPIIKNVQGRTKHIGKLADKQFNLNSSNSKQEEIDRLNSLLKRAVAEERYEDAVEYKRKIKEINDKN
ncbi:MAG: hypothetical protein PHO33_01615 [Clostridia bacterium]|nr:hypothetical protein [Clostridia bacterium]